MQPARRRLYETYGSKVDPAGDFRSVMALFPELAEWQARYLLTDVRKYGRPGVATDPEPAERGTRVEESPDGLEVRHTDTEINARIMNVDDLVDVAQIDLTKWEIASHRVNTWGVVTKDEDGNPTVTRLWQVSASLKPRLIPLVPLDWPPPPVFVVPLSIAPPPQALRRAVILPDMQIGYRWRNLAEGVPWLQPYHDRRAIDIGLQTIVKVQPEEVILLGDNLDLQELSTRWAFGDDARQTTPLAIREYAWLLRRIREIAPSARFTKMQGNHEKRLEKYLEERAGALANLRHFDGRKALGLRELLGLDVLQVESFGYPDPYWLWNRVEVEHGRTVRAGGGATAAAVIARREHSLVYGHNHRRELAHRLVEGPWARREIFAGSPGCLCHVDGRVPGSDRPDWQQGIGIITSLDGSDAMDFVRIERGRAVLGDELLTGRDYSEELADVTGARALREAA